jgi:hypothetical protein
MISLAARTTLVFTFVVTAFLLFLYGDGVAPWSEASAAMTGSANVDEIRWIWLPASLVVVVGLSLVPVVFRKK